MAPPNRNLPHAHPAAIGGAGGVPFVTLLAGLHGSVSAYGEDAGVVTIVGPTSGGDGNLLSEAFAEAESIREAFSLAGTADADALGPLRPRVADLDGAWFAEWRLYASGATFSSHPSAASRPVASRTIASRAISASSAAGFPAAQSHTIGGASLMIRESVTSVREQSQDRQACNDARTPPLHRALLFAFTGRGCASISYCRQVVALITRSPGWQRTTIPGR